VNAVNATAEPRLRRRFVFFIFFFLILPENFRVKVNVWPEGREGFHGPERSRLIAFLPVKARSTIKLLSSNLVGQQRIFFINNDMRQALCFKHMGATPDP
jgi:hypothetical protein